MRYVVSRASAWALLTLSALMLGMAGCSNPPKKGTSEPPPSRPRPDGGTVDDTGFDWDLPPGFPLPAVPEDNPMTAAKVALGRHLFYDRRLSGNGTYRCASCHRQELAFTDGRAQALGSTGERHPRSAMGLANVAYAATLTWAHPLLETLERQVNLPLYGDAPIEMGMPSIEVLESRLHEVPRYQALFAAAFPDEPAPISAANVNRALAAFQRILISGRSPFDRYFYDGEQNAISPSARRGFLLFNGHPFECFHCHSGFNFSDHIHWADKAALDAPYHNTGLYNVDGQGAYPTPNRGLLEVTQEPSDMGRFRAPSLRNVAETAPYMHDGSIATLSEVIDHYSAGGRTLTKGPNAGDGRTNPYKNALLPGFPISDQDRADLIAFLEALTDEAFLKDARFADPWPADEPH